MGEGGAVAEENAAECEDNVSGLGRGDGKVVVRDRLVGGVLAARCAAKLGDAVAVDPELVGAGDGVGLDGGLAGAGRDAQVEAIPGDSVGLDGGVFRHGRGWGDALPGGVVEVGRGEGGSGERGVVAGVEEPGGVGEVRLAGAEAGGEDGQRRGGRGLGEGGQGCGQQQKQEYEGLAGKRWQKGAPADGLVRLGAMVASWGGKGKGFPQDRVDTEARWRLIS